MQETGIEEILKVNPGFALFAHGLFSLMYDCLCVLPFFFPARSASTNCFFSIVSGALERQSIINKLCLEFCMCSLAPIALLWVCGVILCFLEQNHFHDRLLLSPNEYQNLA